MSGITLCRRCLVVLDECACGWFAKASSTIRNKDTTVVVTDTDQRFLRSMRILYGVCRKDYEGSS